MKKSNRTSLARALAPEDIRPGMDVAVLYVVEEPIPLFFVDELRSRTIEPPRVLLLPCGSGAPLRVLEVCLPFVLVRGPDNSHFPLDVRRYRLARLPKAYAKEARKWLKGEGKP